MGATIEASGGKIEVDDLPEVQGDRLALFQLLQNLMENSLKFHDGHDSPRVRVTAVRIDSSWRISVRDNGIGMAKEHLTKIFKPFNRLHGANRYEGCGLGLAMCKKIVDQHGGRLWAESQPRPGQHVSFYDPRHDRLHFMQCPAPSGVIERLIIISRVSATSRARQEAGFFSNRRRTNESRGPYQPSVTQP